MPGVGAVHVAVAQPPLHTPISRATHTSLGPLRALSPTLSLSTRAASRPPPCVPPPHAPQPPPAPQPPLHTPISRATHTYLSLGPLGPLRALSPALSLSTRAASPPPPCVPPPHAPRSRRWRRCMWRWHTRGRGRGGASGEREWRECVQWPLSAVRRAGTVRVGAGRGKGKSAHE